MTSTRLAGIGLTSARARNRLIAQLVQAGISDARVLEALRQTPRHLFIEDALSSRAYENTALPIGYGQTISQPLIVARMLEALLRGPPLQRVLEIGTGSGYLTALLARLVPELYSVERVAMLAARARRVLRELKVRNVALMVGDGSTGMKRGAPFDGIIASAAPLSVPPAYLEQLAEGGRLVLPVGPDSAQTLLRITRSGTRHTTEDLGPVSFVPLQSGRA